MQCPSCGKSTPDSGAFCLHCGTRLRTTPARMGGGGSSQRVERVEKGLSVSCAVPGCASPVIGQCTGYKGSCGRYYCAVHSTGTLCSDCAGRKAEDERIERVSADYLQTIKTLQREVRSAAFNQQIALTGVGAVLAGLIGCGLTSSYNYSSQQAGGFFLFLAFGAFCVALIWYSIRANQISHAKAAEIDQQKPGFLDFYKAWRAEEQKKQMMAGLAIAGVILAALVAAAASSSEKSREDERVRNAVDDELRRRGY